MVYECFYFHNELELLDLKFHNLDGVVDKFVIVEAPLDNMLVPKPLYYWDNRKKFEEFQDKVIHILCKPDDPAITEPYYRFLERVNQLYRGLTDCRDDDIILFTDPDLILKNDIVEKAKRMLPMTGCAELLSDWFAYYMDFLYPNEQYHFTRAAYHRNIDDVYKWVQPVVSIPHAGYHFSKLGGVDTILENLKGYPHQELNNGYTSSKEVLLKKMEDGVGWDDMGAHKRVMRTIPYDPAYYPDYVNQHPEIFAKHFRGGMNVSV